MCIQLFSIAYHQLLAWYYDGAYSWWYVGSIYSREGPMENIKSESIQHCIYHIRIHPKINFVILGYLFLAHIMFALIML